jgi:uncharacterized protein (DUF2249 family)
LTHRYRFATEWLNEVFGYDAKESGPATWRMTNSGVQVRSESSRGRTWPRW